MTATDNLLVVSTDRAQCSECGADAHGDTSRATRCAGCGAQFDAVALMAWTNNERGLHHTLPHVWPEPFEEYLSALLLPWERPIEPFGFEVVNAES